MSVERASSILRVKDLELSADIAGRTVVPVRNVGFELHRGGALGLVGESGSGKSLTLKAILGLLPPGVHQSSGSIEFTIGGRALDDPAEVRGRGLAMIPQEPMTALNPTMRAGEFIAESARVHQGLSQAEGHEMALGLLKEVGVPDAEGKMRAWPHELSGGLRQRVVIAAALATDPHLLLCDEPTTALDATVQDQILGLLDRIRKERNLSLVFVSHDLGVIRQLCDTVAVMYSGQIVESGLIDDVFKDPAHAYTLGLLQSLPELVPHGEPLIPIEGQPPLPIDRPSGCTFHPRCPFAVDECRTVEYALTDVGSGHRSSCIRAADLPESGL